MISLDDLKNGKRARVSSRELAQLRGCSKYTLERERWLGRGIRFQKDFVTGRVWYACDDVLAYFRQASVRGTFEYDTSTQNSRLSNARKMKAQKRQ